MQPSLVSVIIPTYNHAHYVLEAINSAVNQTYKYLEIMVIDDGSTDGTINLLKDYGGRILYFYKPNGGTPNALNYGIKHAHGDYICWLSADDRYRLDKIEKQVELMERQPELGFSYTSFTVIDGAGVPQYDVYSPYHPYKGDMIKNLYEGCFINGSSVIMRRGALNQVGWFDESLPQAHDYDLWLRLLKHFPCGFINEVLLEYRWHGANMSQYPDKSCEEEVKRRAKLLFPELL